MKKGVYVLILKMSEPRKIKIGSLGEREYSAGFYAYVGSAMGGLEGRIGRHLRKEKRLRWHIDHLLQFAEVVQVMTLETGQKGGECLIAQGLKGFPVMKGFGSSDCRCPGHLFFSPSLEGLRLRCQAVIQEVASSLRKRGG